VRQRLLAWQWSDYTAKHGDRGNLVMTREGVATIVALAGMGVSVLLQGRGHARDFVRSHSL
jgi:hypothetical protein